MFKSLLNKWRAGVIKLVFLSTVKNNIAPPIFKIKSSISSLPDYNKNWNTSIPSTAINSIFN